MGKIFNFLRDLYERISEIGVKKKYGSRLKQKVRLINQLWLLYAISSYCIGIQVYFSVSGFFHPSFFFIFISLASSASILLNWVHRHNASLVVLFVAAFFGLFFLDSMTQGKAGFAMFYFGGLIGLMFLFGLSNSKRILFLLLFMLCCISVNIYTDYRIFASPDYNEESLTFTYFLNVILSFIVFIYLSFTVNNTIVKKERMYYINFMKERIHKEEIAQKALREKENLLSELHHRVKNSLAIIAGMLNLQSDAASSQKMKNALQESRSRIISMSLVHDILYKSPSHSQIDFAEYCKDLNASIQKNFSPKQLQNINIEYFTQPTFLNLNDAVPFGLIFNELLTSSYNKISKENTKANVEIFLFNEEFVELIVSYKNEKSNSGEDDFFDSQVKAIVNELSSQLNARLKYEYVNGFKFQMRFLKNNRQFISAPQKQILTN